MFIEKKLTFATLGMINLSVVLNYLEHDIMIGLK